MAKSKDHLSGTKALMGALVRMKPKPREEMKVGKKREPTEVGSRSRSAQKINKDRNSPKARG
ncbi:hypothetical protein [Nitrobacter sp. 62-13]|jgi:hypothetical protein|uniref:hypothetical protein n=1 Tax=Nitrobacter sp. 62-13 TaxID=1895797 RepID=UPI0025D47BE2|nr:hypothetical protein [Nitrobacter sp. 62-13]